MKRSTNDAEPEEGDDLVGLGAGGPLPRADAGTASPTVSRTVRSWNSSAPWNERPRPSRARFVGDRWRASRPRISIVAAAAHVAADGVHQRRLAGPVGADEPDDLAGPDVQVDVDDDGAAP